MPHRRTLRCLCSYSVWFPGMRLVSRFGAHNLVRSFRLTSRQRTGKGTGLLHSCQTIEPGRARCCCVSRREGQIVRRGRPASVQTASGCYWSVEYCCQIASWLDRLRRCMKKVMRAIHLCRYLLHDSLGTARCRHSVFISLYSSATAATDLQGKMA